MKYCRDCRHYYTKGTMGKWCCNFGKKCEKAIGHCKLKNGRVFIKEKEKYASAQS
jgi:hypothetical protein